VDILIAPQLAQFTGRIGLQRSNKMLIYSRGSSCS